MEVGSGDGLSAHVFTAALQEAGVPVAAYTHIVPRAEDASGVIAAGVTARDDASIYDTLLKRIRHNGLLEVITPIIGKGIIGAVIEKTCT